MSGRSSIVSVSRCEPRRRASAAGIASSKNSHTCAAPSGTRSSRAAGAAQAAAVSRNARHHPASRPCRSRRPGRSTSHPGAAGRRRRRRLSLIPAGQVPADHVVGDRQESAVGTLRTLDPRLLADTAHPLVRASRCIPLAGPSALEASRVDIFAPAKERSEEADLGLWARLS